MPFATDQMISDLRDALLGNNYRDKLDLLRRYPISPPNGTILGLTPSASSTNQDWGKFKIRDVDEMVGYIRLIPATEIEKIGSITFEFRLPTQINSAKLRTLYRIPCWFLPWQSKRVVKLKITDLNDNGGNLTFSNGNVMSNPGLFFTAAVSGCSVFAVGDTRHPSVYHGGFLPGAGDPALQAGETTEQFWRRMIGRQGSTKRIRGVGKTDYVNELQTNYQSNTDRLGSTSRALELETRLGRRKDIRDFNKMQGVRVNPWGCVFGLRNDGGNWAFELVKNATMMYWQVVRKGVFGGKKTFAGEVRPGTPRYDRNTEDLDLGNPAQWTEQAIVNSVTLGYTRFFPGAGRSHFKDLDTIQVY